MELELNFFLCLNVGCGMRRTELLSRYASLFNYLENLLESATCRGGCALHTFRQLKGVVQTIMSLTRMVEVVAVTEELHEVHCQLLDAFNKELGT